ncbi:MAG: restriction endonuclease [Bacteroidota bacterium]
MTIKNLQITKASGDKDVFSVEKVKASLRKSGADEEVINHIIGILEDELYDGISTKEIYNRAFNLLKKKNRSFASRYKLKNAIYELGPTGFPFEKFIAAILKNSGFKVEVGKILQGNCVTHELDVIAVKDKVKNLIECKFHTEPGKACDVKIPLYIHSRFRDIQNHLDKKHPDTPAFKGWVATNTRFTEDAKKYGKCVGMNLLSWDLPKGNALKDRIDHTGLYPITVSTLLSSREKQFLLSRDVVLCKELIDDKFYLDHLGISEGRKSRIFKEMEMLCEVS